jgi:4-amino-4-deoxy-L-arabinose transferase-like glycosyltransferase
VAFHDRYGYFRDELYYIACSDHLDWGYVDHPPLSIALLWASRALLGDSLQAIRLLPSLAGAAVVILAALMARRLGGSRATQGFASLAVVVAPVLMGHGRYFSMNPFDVLFWALALYVLLLIFSGESPRLWLLFGGIIGLGLLNKYSIGFLCIALVVGLVLTGHRMVLLGAWFWLGAIVAAVLFIPHVLWQVAHGFPSLEFMRNASTYKNVDMSVLEFMGGQVQFLNPAAAPLWLLGVYFFLARPEARQYRPFGWIYCSLVILMVVTKAKVYYLSPVYPVLFAGGAVCLERLLKPQIGRWARPAYAGVLVAIGLIGLPFALPVLPVDVFIAYQDRLGMKPRAEETNRVGVLPQSYADQFGWEEFVALIDGAYRTLSPDEQAQCVIYARNYGQAGAVDFFGKKYALPNALCAHNSYWLWGPGTRAGAVSIVVGAHRTLAENLDDLGRAFDEVTLVGTTDSQYAMPFEVGRQIFLCKGMKTSFQAIWPAEKFYI